MKVKICLMSNVLQRFLNLYFFMQKVADEQTGPLTVSDCHGLWKNARPIDSHSGILFSLEEKLKLKNHNTMFDRSINVKKKQFQLQVQETPIVLVVSEKGG